jgi:hypothetical protein
MSVQSLHIKITRRQVVGCFEWAQHVDGCLHCVTHAASPQPVLRNSEFRKAPKTESFDPLHSFRLPFYYRSTPTNNIYTVILFTDSTYPT